MRFDEIYDRYFDGVYRYVLALSRDDSIAEEITQETFFRALQKIESFRGECKLRVWLCQIAKNIYYSDYKKQKKRISAENVDDITDNISVEEKLLYRETAFGIHKKLHSLAEPYKEVFSLRVFGELSFREIGELFEKTENWARVTFYRAKLKLKED